MPNLVAEFAVLTCFLLQGMFVPAVGQQLLSAAPLLSSSSLRWSMLCLEKVHHLQFKRILPLIISFLFHKIKALGCLNYIQWY